MSNEEKQFYKLWYICIKEHYVATSEHVSEGYFMVFEIIHNK